MENGVTSTCDCGAVRFRLAPLNGTRCVCYCASCQAFLVHLGRSDIADKAGGSDLFQTGPNLVTLEQGGEHLANLRLTGKGPLRWYATCCNTPICNTGAKRTVPLAGFLVRTFDDKADIGPVIARVNRKDAKGPVSDEGGAMRSLILAFLKRAVVLLITGKYKQTPFFSDAGVPVVPTTRLSQEDRARAYQS
jgi:hypothetical protein